jgi:hypothetical protein
MGDMSDAVHMEVVGWADLAGSAGSIPRASKATGVLAL